MLKYDTQNTEHRPSMHGESGYATVNAHRDERIKGQIFMDHCTAQPPNGLGLACKTIGKQFGSIIILSGNLQSSIQSHSRQRLVSCPAPPCTCEKGGSGVLNDFPCHSSPIRELESDCRTSSSTRSSMPAVRCTCTGNAIITFFTPFDPAPCDKKCRSEHQTLFPLFGGGVWGRD